MEDFLIKLPLLLDSMVRLSVPLLFAALAGLYSERSGIFDISLEGKMLGAAFAAAAASYAADSAVLGLFAGVLVAVALSLVHGFASISQRGNQIVSGVAINFVALGLTVLLGQAWFSQGGRTPQLGANGRFRELTLPFAEELKDIPFFGTFYEGILSGHNILVYAAFLAVPLSWWVLFRTRFGLRLRAVGENPAAVDTAGISVIWLRYRAIIICGVLCGFAGAYLSIAQASGFTKDMAAGRGFIALAALIFAKWKPVPVMMACLLFGLLQAIPIQYPQISLPGIGIVPGQVMQALPYVL
ncbi:MAG: ABC transporter permease, partial [Hyphomicrobiales bacterium]